MHLRCIGGFELLDLSLERVTDHGPDYNDTSQKGHIVQGRVGYGSYYVSCDHEFQPKKQVGSKLMTKHFPLLVNILLPVALEFQTHKTISDKQNSSYYYSNTNYGDYM